MSKTMEVTKEFAELMSKLSKAYRAKPVKAIRCLEMPGDFEVDGIVYLKGDYLVFQDGKYFGMSAGTVKLSYEEIVRNRQSKDKK